MINRVILVGRLARDPELRKTQTGISKTSFTVACDKIGDGADFIDCVAWRQPADFLSQYGKKGNLIGVDGRLSTRTYEKDGRTVKVTEVTADNVKLLSRNEQQAPEEDLEELLPF